MHVPSRSRGKSHPDRQHWPQRYSVGDLELAVNVSTTQLMTHGFPEIVADILRRTGTDPRAVILEMTENIFIDDNERAKTILQDTDAGFDNYDDMLRAMVNGLTEPDQELVLGAVDASRHRRAKPPAECR